ncbi:Serine/threonine-protein phosphatase 2A activator [Cladochytrium tenue]|nr:Serine/threonine-protein phosphatase 2A activator [Cladochytrium tenue]
MSSGVKTGGGRRMPRVWEAGSGGMKYSAEITWQSEMSGMDGILESGEANVDSGSTTFESGSTEPIMRLESLGAGPFHEHTPALYDISGVPGWAKDCSGLLKMYVAEVLRKFPVVQHLRFRRLLPFEPAECARIHLN